MIAPMLAKVFDPARGLPPGRWIAEAKLDGFRAIWDGPRRELRGRKGALITSVPGLLTELKELYGDFVLDGELYAGDWSRTASAARRSAPTGECSYYVFDWLGQDGTTEFGLTLEKRREALRQYVLSPFNTTEKPNGIGRWVKPIEDYRGFNQALTVLIQNAEDAEKAARDLVEKGYEGAMLKRLDSPYLPGVRSDAWLKLKFTDEIDATVIGAEPGSGRLSNSLGALSVETETGAQFRIGTKMTDALRLDLWQRWQAGKLQGKTVTVAYQKGEVGRFPRFIRLREEL